MIASSVGLVESTTQADGRTAERQNRRTPSGQRRGRVEPGLGAARARGKRTAMDHEQPDLNRNSVPDGPQGAQPIERGREPGRRARRWRLFGAAFLAVGLVAVVAQMLVTRDADAANRRRRWAVPTTTTTAATQTTAPAPAAPGAGRWSPQAGAPWQWQLTTPVDQSVDVPVYDIDLFDNTKGVIDALHAKGRKVICYFDAGAWESYRTDADQFPAAVIGRSTGWDNERWLDIRQIDVIGPLIAKRLDMAVAKGCDAVEPDQDNGWENNPGFPITRAQSIAWNRWVAQAAHDRGLSVGLKNSIGETAELEPFFDWALNEECFQYKECDQLAPFTRAGKTVLQVEYKTDPASFCPQARALGFASMRKNLNLDAARTPC